MCIAMAGHGWKDGWLMSCETLACTNCGSGDVREVKPNTYFCNHCDSVFKHVDPARLTVGPAFCEHGNPVEVQCQVCKIGMCRSRCDIVRQSVGLVSTEGFGYLEQGAGRNIDVGGPFLILGKLLTSLTLDRGEGLIHACHGCVIRAVPAAVARICAGTLCESVRCRNVSAGTCPCCHGGFCQECSVPGVEKQWLLKGSGMLGRPATICAWDPDGDRASESFPIDKPMPEGMCGPCVGENREKIAAIAARICRQDYAGKLVPIAGDSESYDRFKVPATPIPTRRKNYPVERMRVVTIARRYAAEVNARLRQLPVMYRACERGKPSAVRRGVPYADYVIVDERDRVVPAAVSGVIWDWPGTGLGTRSAPGRQSPR